MFQSQSHDLNLAQQRLRSPVLRNSFQHPAPDPAVFLNATGRRKGVWARSWSRNQEGRGWGERGVGTVGGEVASGKRRYAGCPLGGARLNKT